MGDAPAIVQGEELSLHILPNMAKSNLSFLQVASSLAQKAGHRPIGHALPKFGFSHDGIWGKGVNSLFYKFPSMQRDHGLVHVLTGDGNGKTTSAVGIAVRASGRGLRVAFIQFLKGGLSGELPSLRKLGVEVITGTKHCPNQQKHEQQLAEKGFAIFCKDCFVINEQDKLLTKDAFGKAKSLTSSGEYDLVILDEKIGRASVGKECRSRWSPYH